MNGTTRFCVFGEISRRRVRGTFPDTGAREATAVGFVGSKCPGVAVPAIRDRAERAIRS